MEARKPSEAMIKIAEGMLFRGEPVRYMERERLMEIIGWLASSNQSMRDRHLHELSVLGG